MAAGKQQSKEKFGYITLTGHDSKTDGKRLDYWLRWREPATKKDTKFRLGNIGRDEARREARLQNAAITDTRAKLRVTPAAAVRHMATAPTLSEAIDEALTARAARHNPTPQHVATLRSQQKRFLAFMADRFPTVREWKDLRRTPHVRGYIEQLQADGLKPVSIRHYMEVISITGGYFAEEYEEAGYWPLQAMRLAPLSEEAPKKNFMTAGQLERAIATARELNLPGAELAFVLGGWCGMNLREIARLTAADIDFNAGTITVQKSKNRYRKRTIPVPAYVLDAVREHIEAQAVVGGNLFLNARGKPADNLTLSWSMHTVLHKLGLHPGRQRDNVRQPVSPGPVQVEVQPVCTGATVTAKDVRKTFINLARAAGCERETLRRYIGHSPSDVMSAHYEAFTTETFRAEIVAKIEAYRATQLQPAITGAEAEA